MTMMNFPRRLDTRCERAETTAPNKRWQRTTSRRGHPVEKEPPVSTPNWALSAEWTEELRRRDEQLAHAEQTYR